MASSSSAHHPYDAVNSDEDDDSDEEYHESPSPTPMMTTSQNVNCESSSSSFLVASLGSKVLDLKSDNDQDELLSQLSVAMDSLAETYETQNMKKMSTTSTLSTLLLKIEHGRIKIIELSTNECLQIFRISKISSWKVDIDKNYFAFITNQENPICASDLLLPSSYKCYMYHCEDDGLESSTSKISNIMKQEIETLKDKISPSSETSEGNDKFEIKHSLNIASDKSSPDVEFTCTMPNDEDNIAVIVGTFLGTVNVTKSSGIDILNDAIDEVVLENFSSTFHEMNKCVKLENVQEHLEEPIGELSTTSTAISTTERRNIACNIMISPLAIKIDEKTNKSSNMTLSPSKKLHMEVRIRYLSFFGISKNDKTKCALIYQKHEDTFQAIVFKFKNEIDSGTFTKYLADACKIRYEKIINSRGIRSRSDSNDNKSRSKIKHSQSMPVNFGNLKNSTFLKNSATNSIAAVSNAFSKIWPKK